MAIFTRSKLLFLFFLILSLVLASQCDDQNPRGQDPRHELESCLRERQVQGKCPEQQIQCQRSCVLRCESAQQREKGHGEDNQGRKDAQREPEERFRECQQRCWTHEQVSSCVQRCQQEYQREKQQQQHRGHETREGETNPEREQEKENNPYLFESQRFESPFRISHGDLRVVEKFTERSQLLRGIEKYRVAFLELEPQTFMLPHHCDSEAIFFIVRGQGTISIAGQDDKKSFNLEKGDVFRLPAGTTLSFINRDNNEKFFVYALAKSGNAPGLLQEFFSAAGENPESFYTAFSSDILETAFNTPRDRLERLFRQQKHGIVIKASEEQIRAISGHASRFTEQTRGKTQGPFNLLKERPLFESRFGQFIEVSPERFEQLRDLDIAVGYMNINQGGMVLPYYNTRSTRLVMVVEGNGRFEMACPHLGRQGRGQGSSGERELEQEQEEGNVRYQKVRGNLKAHDVLVVPAGHPITFIAAGGSNLRLVGFGINAHNNKKNFLAGKQNIWKNVEREAEELSFNLAGKEVEEIFEKQDESYFVAGGREVKKEERDMKNNNCLQF